MPMFDTMEFPDYQFREFPMAIAMKGGKPSKNPYDDKGKSLPIVTVKDDVEFQALMAGEAEVRDGKVRTEADERADLVVRAGQLNVDVDPDWPIGRLAAVIEATEKSVEIDRRWGEARIREAIGAAAASVAPA